MKQKTIILLLLAIVVLPGCERYTGLIQHAFHQADEIDVSVCQARSYIRSQGCYDYFSTVILYDALWLSPDVKQVHNILYTTRTGLEAKAVNTSRRAEFYVILGPQAGESAYALTGDAAQWSIMLDVNGRTYQPITCKRIDPDPEYRHILGDHLTQFRDVYHVVFDTQAETPMELILQSPEYRAVLRW